MMFRRALGAGALLALIASTVQAHPGAHAHPHDLAHVGSDLGLGIGAALLICGVCALALKVLRQR